MEGSTPYLEERGLAEAHDTNIFDKLHDQGHTANDAGLGRGVWAVDRDDPIIEQFFSKIPDLCGEQELCGLVWHKKLCPSNGSYELGIHYIHTGQPSQKSAHGVIEYYRDQTSRAHFALKVLQRQDAFHTEEVRCRLRLQHENIADVYGVIVRGGTVCILMEHAGKPLVEERAWFAESSDRMVQLGRQCFRALMFLHVKGYVHCDIKPDNLMILRANQSFILKVIDFGTCRRIREPLPSQAHTTWQYWPPEMWRAREKKAPFLAEAAMDVYAMSLTLYFVQMGSHLMLTITKEAMIKQPELVKMMGIPESIPPELRAVMNLCMEVNNVRRCTAEEAANRLSESEPLLQKGGSSREKYLANLNSIASVDGSQQPLIVNLIQQSGSSKSQLAEVSVGQNETHFQTEVTRGPEAVRFEQKTSRIFQQLKEIDGQKSADLSWRSRSETRQSEDVGEPSVMASSGGFTLGSKPASTTSLMPHYSQELQGSYPFASLLEKLALEYKTQPQNSLLPSIQTQVTELPTPPQDISKGKGKLGKTKALSSISRQKNRAKGRQKSYDRIQNPPKITQRKFSAGALEPKSSVTLDLNKTNVQKLWPLPAVPKNVKECADPALATTEDDMDCVIDVFDPKAFKMNTDDDITDYMFQLVEQQEHEEGPEKIRQDIDGMSLSGGPEGTRGESESSSSTHGMGLTHKTTIGGIPNFDLLS